MPKAKTKSLPAEEMAGEEAPLHGAINEKEAKLYVKKLDVIFENMAREIREGIPNAMKNAITALKQAIGKMIPGTDEADIRAVLKAVFDPTCLAIQKQMEETE